MNLVKVGVQMILLPPPPVLLLLSYDKTHHLPIIVQIFGCLVKNNFEKMPNGKTPKFQTTTPKLVSFNTTYLVGGGCTWGGGSKFAELSNFIEIENFESFHQFFFEISRNNFLAEAFIVIPSILLKSIQH